MLKRKNYDWKRTPLKRSVKPIKKVSVQQVKKNVEDAEQSRKRIALFFEVWDERVKDGYCVCFETGQKLFDKANLCIYHHCLYKKPYPQYDLCKENIVIVHPHVHNLTHFDAEKTPRILKYTQELLSLHKQNKL